MQKIVNIVAIASGVVSLAVVGSGLYVYVNRGAIADGVKQQVMDAALGSLGSLGGGLPASGGLGVGGSALPTGANDLDGLPDQQASIDEPAVAPVF
tara:strand:- start:147 stop:434 length:288 start_codon:yes stop_codon:yes gene_type:complete